MSDSLNPADLKIVSTLAEYRLLTTGQLTTLVGLTDRTARRQLQGLAGHGFIQTSPNDTGPTRGRPENLLSLTNIAVEALRADRVLGEKVAREHVTGGVIRDVAHQLLLNSFRIQLHQLQGAHPEFSVQFLSSNSPFAMREGGGQPLVHDRAGTEGTEFVPDGVFSITHRSLQRTLLFLLEVDMGTETIGSPTADGVIRRKIITYQSYFQAGEYRRYEQIFGAELKGFRLLFLTHTSRRLQTLCRFVAAMPPSDFIWLTDQGQMSSDGVAAAIWARGGQINAMRRSILGSQMPAPDKGRAVGVRDGARKQGEPKPR